MKAVGRVEVLVAKKRRGKPASGRVVGELERRVARRALDVKVVACHEAQLGYANVQCYGPWDSVAFSTGREAKHNSKAVQVCKEHKMLILGGTAA
jgi:hypothetical protein